MMLEGTVMASKDLPVEYTILLFHHLFISK